ncbi:hypothetical protein [Herbaspirillum huttiense]|uniref:hypothetical protein n=1 Tax=Herbaspirillum huttiense TaxID=863372 RepID=UPI0039AF5492
MTNKIQELLKLIPAQAQRQDSTNDQVRDLYAIAVHFGLYDAADLVKIIAEKR